MFVMPLLNKTSSKVGKEEQREREPKSNLEAQKPKVGHKGGKEQIMFWSPHQ
jgi:hypothetical protein